LAFLVYQNTFVVTGADIFDEAVQGGRLVKDPRGQDLMFTGSTFVPTGLADLFASGPRSWVRQNLIDALALGVDGWMADFGEWYPADKTAVLPSDGSDPESAHHRYPVAWAEVNQEAADQSGRSDVVIFHRSGYTGAQSKARVLWLGDQNMNFGADDGLPTIIPMQLGLGVSGFPIAVSDIAGYTTQISGPSTKDLFFRWTSLGALGPVMRTHHGRAARLTWRWSTDAETTRHFKRWADLHTALFPLWKGLAEDAAKTGAPILRPIAFLEPGNAALHNVTDEYLIGDALMVAPVVTASTATRAVIFPKGSWFRYYPSTSSAGTSLADPPIAAARATFPCPLTEALIFARAGAIVPRLPPGVESLRAAPGLLTLDDVRYERRVDVFLGGSSVMTEPEGGAYRVDSASLPARITSAAPANNVVLGARHLAFDALPNVEVLLTDSDGNVHHLSSGGLDPRMQVRYDVFW
jgi:alpha-glucosidase (family GH31 glycosyl hydrolase)